MRTTRTYRLGFMLLVGAAIATASCRKEQVASQGDEGTCEITVGLEALTRADIAKTSAESKIYSADLYVYKNGRLENQTRTESADGNLDKVSARVTWGTKEIKVITNASKEKADLAGRLGATYGAAPANEFLDNKPGALVHHGYAGNVTVSASSKDVTVSLKTSCARVVLKGIQNSLPASLGSVHVNRVFLVRVKGAEDRNDLWYDGNSVKADDAAGKLIVAGVDKDVANGYGYTFPDGGLVLYAFANPSKEASSASQTDNVTKLVVEAVVDGMTYYYPVGIPSIENNKSYEIDRIFITRTGSDGPNKYLTEKAFGVRMQVSPWSGAVPNPSYTGEQRYLELVKEGDTDLGVRSYEAGLVGLRPVPWTAAVEVSRDGGTTWEKTTADALPWLSAKLLSGSGSTDGTDPLKFVRDDRQVTYPFRVTVTQEGGRTASAVLSRPEYTCTGTASGTFGFAILSVNASFRAAGEVIPAKSGKFSAELPKVDAGWGWVFNKQGWNEINQEILTVDSIPSAAATMTSARGMFSSCPNLTSVADFPRGFHPTNCRAMFSGCKKLTRAPYLDTSGGGDFENFMFDCQSLESVPSYSFVNATSMKYSFRSCVKLTAVGSIKSSKCTEFAGLFMDCHELVTIPELDTSSGTGFYGVFMYCKVLKKIPQMNTSKGTSFMGMFQGCSALEEIPSIDTSNGTVFKDMFLYCGSLKKVPNLNTSKGTNFGDMFNYCSSLEEIPALDTSNGTNFSAMFNSSTKIRKIPKLDMSKATSTGTMFYNVASLSDFGGMSGLKVSVDMGMCYSLTHDSIMNVINNLARCTGQTLTLGNGNLAKLSAAEKKVATDKGWTLK